MRALLVVVLTCVSLAGCLTGEDGDAPADSEPEDRSPREKQIATGDGEWLEAPWGFQHRDYEPVPDGTHAIFYMEGYLGASTPANGLDYDGPAPLPGSPTHYVRMDDGTLIGVTVHHEFSGILGDSGFALVFASVRGTGCSGGDFDLFDMTHREDGATIIETLGLWEGFEEDVGMFGASYSGITALLVASQAPPHLKAVSANMVIGDMYRDIAYPGGVPNIAFPGYWTVGYRQGTDTLGAVGGAAAQDEICAQNVAGRRGSHAGDHAGAGMYTRRTDDTMYRIRSPVEFADQITVPTLIGQSYQDEQTGPRGGLTVWPKLQPEPVPDPCATGETYVPRHLMLTNGVHATSTDNGIYYAFPWFRYWLKGEMEATRGAPAFCDAFDETVLVHWEKRGDWVEPSAVGPATVPGDVETQITHATDYPLPETHWQPWTLHADGTLDTDAPLAEDGTRSYAFGDQRYGSWYYDDGGRATEGSPLTQPEAEDVLRYRSAPLDEGLTVLGPLTLRFTGATTATDTDWYATVADVDPSGDVTYLQKGMLRASHRAISFERSWYNETGELIRVSHEHTNPTPVSANDPVEYVLDIYSLGHQFRPGHQIQVQIHTPPASDGRWGYGPVGAPAVNTIYHGGSSPATLLLPVIPSPELGDGPGCGVPDGYRCVAGGDH